MKKTILKFFLPTLGLLLLSCTTMSDKDLSHLNGYWEIEEVRSHGEIFTPRGGAVLVDLYQLDSMRGYKKKLAPNFSGNYNSSESQLNFTIINQGGDFYIEYNEAQEPWKEKIITVSSTKLVLEHSDKVYVYKRHEKISI